MSSKVVRVAACWGGFVALLGAGIALEHWLRPAPYAGIGIAAVLIGATLWASLAWWRRVDEAVRDAHKTAFCWGGTFGLALSGLAIVALVEMRAQEATPASFANEPAGYVILGFMLCLLPQTIGYAIVWAGWWLSKR